MGCSQTGNVLISNIHLSVDFLPFPKMEADVLVLAGDIARPAGAIELARSTHIPTLYVASNHEFYGSAPQSPMND